MLGIITIHAARPRRSVLLGAALILAGAGSAARAQSAPAEICTGKATPAEEIACLRGALAQSEATLARVLSGQTAARPAPAPTAPPASAPARQAERPSLPAAAVASAPRRAEPPLAPPAAAPADPVAGLGAEQIPGARREAPASPVLQAVVVASEEDREGLLTLSLDSGQRWKQVEKPSLQIVINKNRQYPVEISKSGFGGYRMYFAELKRTIVVKRLS